MIRRIIQNGGKRPTILLPPRLYTLRAAFTGDYVPRCCCCSLNESRGRRERAHNPDWPPLCRTITLRADAVYRVGIKYEVHRSKGEEREGCCCSARTPASAKAVALLRYSSLVGGISPRVNAQSFV